METLLSVINHKDSSKDEIIRCKVARRFVNGNLEYLKQIKNSLIV